MIDKVRGQAIYAVMSFGGFLGMASSISAAVGDPEYDERKGGY